MKSVFKIAFKRVCKNTTKYGQMRCNRHTLSITLQLMIKNYFLCKKKQHNIMTDGDQDKDNCMMFVYYRITIVWQSGFNTLVFHRGVRAECPHWRFPADTAAPGQHHLPIGVLRSQFPAGPSHGLQGKAGCFFSGFKEFTFNTIVFASLGSEVTCLKWPVMQYPPCFERITEVYRKWILLCSV